MDQKRFFAVLDGMLESGDYEEEIFEKVLDDLDIPQHYVAALTKIIDDYCIFPDEQLRYIESIRKGKLEPKMVKKELVDCLRTVLQYRYEFYRRSRNADPAVLEEYMRLTEDVVEVLPFQFDPTLPLEYNIGRLEEFKLNVEEVLRHYYPREEKYVAHLPRTLVQFGITTLKESNEDEDQDQNEKELEVFRLWRRALTVWDLVEEKAEAERTAKFLVGVSKKITKEFKVWGTYVPGKLKQLVNQDYEKACGFISSAESGKFPELPLSKKELKAICDKKHADFPDTTCEFCMAKMNS